MTTQGFTTGVDVRNAWSHKVTLISVGFVMGMTAPIELLYAIKLGSSTVIVTGFIFISSLGVFVVDVLGTRFITRIDARLALAVGIAGFAASEVVLGVADGPGLLLAGRGLQGAASALVGGAAFQISVRMFSRPHHTLGSTQGFLMLGSAFGAPFGGYVASSMSGVAGYRLAFWVCCSLGVVVAILIVVLLPNLPPPSDSGRPEFGLPQLSVPPILRMVLTLGLLGNYLRSGVENTAFPLVGNAHAMSSTAIGCAIGLLSAVEILVLAASGRIFERITPSRCLAVALAVGVGAVLLLGSSQGLLSYLTAALLFGLVDGIALSAPPVLIVALSPDASLGVATYRIVCGIGSFTGSGSVNVVIAQLGAAGGLAAISTVLFVGALLAMVTAHRITEPKHGPGDAA